MPSGAAIPAQQRLGADDLAGREIDLRLIVKPELIVAERLAQIAVELRRLLGARLQIGGEEAAEIAAFVLRLVHGEIGVLQKRFGIDPSEG